MDEGTEWAKASGGGRLVLEPSLAQLGLRCQLHRFHAAGFRGRPRARQADCWLGKTKFNAEDSPYRHYYEFFLKAKEKGWIPESMPPASGKATWKPATSPASPS